jgi:hypothetical protein
LVIRTGVIHHSHGSPRHTVGHEFVRCAGSAGVVAPSAGGVYNEGGVSPRSCPSHTCMVVAKRSGTSSSNFKVPRWKNVTKQAKQRADEMVVAQSGQDFATKIGNEHFIQDIGATAT